MVIKSRACEDELRESKSGLETIIDALHKIRSARANINKLSGYITRLKTAVSAFSVIPYIGKIFSAIKPGVTAMEKAVTSAKSKANALESKAQIIRPKLEKLDDYVEYAIELLEWLDGAAEVASETIQEVRDCIANLDDSNAESLLETAVTPFQVSVTPVKESVSTCVEVIGPINDAIGKAKSYVTNTFVTAVTAVTNSLNSVLPSFENLDVIIRPIWTALNHQLCLPFNVACASIRDILGGLSIFSSLVNKALDYLGLPTSLPLPSLPDINLPDLNIDFPIDQWDTTLQELYTTLKAAPKELPGLPTCSGGGVIPPDLGQSSSFGPLPNPPPLVGRAAGITGSVLLALLAPLFAGVFIRG